MESTLHTPLPSATALSHLTVHSGELSRPSVNVPQFWIDWVAPWTPSCNVANLLDRKSFRVGLKVEDLMTSKPKDYKVSLWTDLYHKGNTEGEWHAVPTTFEGVHQCLDKGFVMYMYGVDLVLTCLGIYRFTYKVKHKFGSEAVWAEDFKIDGQIKVKLPVHMQTPWLQEPINNQITHNIYIGNMNAALESVEAGFDCLLNMADDVKIYPEQFSYPIIYKRCPLKSGANNPISSQVIERVVKWLRFMSDNCKKILVCSHTGHARAGSVLIAYIYFMNPDLTFEEAYAFVDKRSLVYPHKGLKDVVLGLYPRS